MDMPQLCVRVDLEKIGARLSRLHGWHYKRADVHIWLRSVGFKFNGGSWFCDDGAVNELQDDEVLEVMREVNEEGVTFIHREPKLDLPDRPVSAGE